MAATESARGRTDALPRILIVGSPNVGKSLLFNRLTGQYVTVSNYPGTTVEVARGRSRGLPETYEVIDTPGMYSLTPVTEEERVACAMLRDGAARVVLHVLDAKNIQRMLGLTLQLAEAGFPLVVVLNMADEARDLGVEIEVRRLEAALGVPVVETVATTGQGLPELARRLAEARSATGTRVHYGPHLEEAVRAIAAKLGGADTRRTDALFLLQRDHPERERILRELSPAEAAEIEALVHEARAALPHSVHYHSTLALRERAEEIVAQTARFPREGASRFRETLSRLCMNPLTGIPILAVVLYFGLYRLVGGFGAGTLVDWIEGGLFEERVNPWVNAFLERAIPWAVARELFGGDYGIITLGFRYAIAIILPVVGTFFLAFALLEDSGYLPRLAMLIDRVFKKIGLNGRAVIPIVLGFGCDTMATIVTRTLESRRERIIASFLLALAVPCSAQLGLILGLLGERPAALALWALFIAGVFVAAGMLAARVVPGRGPSFYMELPPLRLPKPVNVIVKTYTRIVWYFKEVLPLFVLASVLIWLGRVLYLFQAAVRAMEPAVKALGLPAEAAEAFLFGFFRRDYGAAGLFDLQHEKGLTGNQLAVAAITLTLFLPCIAQLLILKKERGWRMALGTSAGVLLIAFGSGFLVHTTLTALGVSL